MSIWQCLPKVGDFVSQHPETASCRSSTSLAYKGKTLELSPRYLARYAVISPATMLKSLIFLERMSWMISLKPLPNSSGEEPSSGLAPRSTRILSSARVTNPGQLANFMEVWIE